MAMLLARIPLALFARYRSIHVQNLTQSAISAATFGAANSLLLPIGVPFLLGRFPAFAVALITLIIGVLIRFPPMAPGLLAGFAASTVRPLRDMGYDLKAGFMLRGQGRTLPWNWTVAVSRRAASRRVRKCH